MPEIDKSQPETADQLGQEILKFATNAEFGTSTYQAISDYFDLNELQNLLTTSLDNAVEPGETPRDAIYWESNLRITEAKIAHLEHVISQKESNVDGYSRAHIHISTGFDDLVSRAYNEAKRMFPDNKVERDKYLEKTYVDVYDQALDAVFRTRGMFHTSE